MLLCGVASRIPIASDSGGGNMAAVLAILTKQRGDMRFVHPSLSHPPSACSHIFLRGHTLALMATLPATSAFTSPPQPRLGIASASAT
jgi:acetyl esterase/lipase